MNIFNAIRRRFFPAATVSSITAAFAKQHAKLLAVADAAAEKESQLIQAQAALRQERAEAADEKAKAIRVANKLAEFTA